MTETPSRASAASADTSAERRSGAAALAVLLAVPTVLFADLLFLGSQLYFGDLTDFYYPIKKILRTILLAGELPSWNPFWSAGQPFAANPEFHIFYPPHWLILLPNFPYWFRIHILLHVYLGLVAGYFLFRDLKLRIPVAVFGALTFGLGGFFLSYMKMPSFYFSVVWIPLIFALGRRLILKPGGVTFAAASLAWGMQLLAGEPTTIVQTGVLLGCFALYEAWHFNNGRLRRALRNLSLVALLSISTFLVGAVQMIPAADHVGETVRARGLSWKMVSTWSMPWVRPLELIYPDILGENYLQWHHLSYPDMLSGYIASFHVGSLAGLLILGALLYRHRPAGIVAIVAVGSFLVAAGSHTPMLRFLYDAGVLNGIRYPEKFALAGVLALTLLAVIFADRCFRRDPRAIRAMLVTSIVVACLSALLAALSFTAIYPGLFQWLWGSPSDGMLDQIVRSTRVDWTIAAVTATIVAAMFGWLRSHEPGRAWLSVAFILVVLDLGLSTNELLGRVQEDFFEPPPLARTLSDELSSSRTFHAANLELKTLHIPWTIAAEAKAWTSRNGMYPRIPGAWGFASVLENDYDMTNLLPTTDIFDAMFAVRRATRSDRFSETIFAMSNVGAVLTYDAKEEARILATPPEELLVDEVTPIRASQRNYPRYYFAEELVKIGSLEDFVNRVGDRERTGDLRDVAYVEFDETAVGSGVVEQTHETSNSVSLTVRSENTAYLVISITPHKYWGATIDGSPATLHTTNIGYQGLLVPAGRHEIALVYRNPLIYVGGMISLLTILALLTTLLVSRGKAETSRAAA